MQRRDKACTVINRVSKAKEVVSWARESDCPLANSLEEAAWAQTKATYAQEPTKAAWDTLKAHNQEWEQDRVMSLDRGVAMMCMTVNEQADSRLTRLHRDTSRIRTRGVA